MSASNRFHRQSRRLPKHQPLRWSVYLRNVVAKDAVLWIAWLLAAGSVFVSPLPFSAYPSSIDFKTLACLFSLMAASGGFMLLGVYDSVAARLVNACRSTRALLASMVAVTFFSSMLVTNDVALIVFVPMTLLAFGKTGASPVLPVVLQTVAANVGSALLPMGNPQNLFLFSRFDMTLASFLSAVYPVCLSGGLLLAVFCLAAKKVDISRVTVGVQTVRWRGLAPYAALFAAAILGVFDLLDYRLVFAAAVALVVLKGANFAQQIDYALLLNFVGFFIFVGNLAHIPEVERLLGDLVGPRPFLAAALSSQVVSNVPAAVLLSGFTDDARALLAGVNAGGCGTLIASMASLISYKLHAQSGGDKKRYLLAFTAVNFLFLAVLSLAWFIAP